MAHTFNVVLILLKDTVGVCEVKHEPLVRLALRSVVLRLQGHRFVSDGTHEEMLFNLSSVRATYFSRDFQDDATLSVAMSSVTFFFFSVDLYLRVALASK